MPITLVTVGLRQSTVNKPLGESCEMFLINKFHENVVAWCFLIHPVDTLTYYLCWLMCYCCRIWVDRQYERVTGPPGAWNRHRYRDDDVPWKFVTYVHTVLYIHITIHLVDYIKGRRQLREKQYDRIFIVSLDVRLEMCSYFCKKNNI